MLELMKHYPPADGRGGTWAVLERKNTRMSEIVAHHPPNALFSINCFEGISQQLKGMVATFTSRGCRYRPSSFVKR